MNNKNTLNILILGLFFIIIIAITVINPKTSVFAIKEMGNSNLQIEVPGEYLTVKPGTEIWFTTKILNLDNTGRMDVMLKYELADKENNLIVEKSETVAIETQASFVGSLNIPQQTKDGQYDLKVKMEAVDSAPFESKESQVTISVSKKNSNTKYIYMAIVLGVFIIMVIVAMIVTPKLKRIEEKVSMKHKIHKIVKDKLKN
jgi:hypothetical protein